jgi:hypothetical protein
MPADDSFLGDTALQLDWPGGHGNETTAIQEQMAYWIGDQINIAFSHRYFIRLTVNGVTDMQRGGVFEAVLQPGGNFLEQWSPGDSEGGFFKIDRAFEFSDAPGLIADPEPQLRIYTTADLVNGGTKKKREKYRWYWLKRSFDSANDYTNVFVLADALNAVNPEPYTRRRKRWSMSSNGCASSRSSTSSTISTVGVTTSAKTCICSSPSKAAGSFICSISTG